MAGLVTKTTSPTTSPSFSPRKSPRKPAPSIKRRLEETEVFSRTKSRTYASKSGLQRTLLRTPQGSGRVVHNLSDPVTGIEHQGQTVARRIQQHTLSDIGEGVGLEEDGMLLDEEGLQADTPNAASRGLMDRFAGWLTPGKANQLTDGERLKTPDHEAGVENHVSPVATPPQQKPEDDVFGTPHSRVASDRKRLLGPDDPAVVHADVAASSSNRLIAKRGSASPPPKPATATESSPLRLDANMYLPETILAQRTVGGKHEFLIQWQGYLSPADHTWEPAETMREDAPHLVEAWEASRKEVAAKKAGKKTVKKADKMDVDDTAPQVFDVQEILDRRKIKGRIYYLVKWEGFEDKKDWTWEPEDTLEVDVPELLETFQESFKEKKKRKSDGGKKKI